MNRQNKSILLDGSNDYGTAGNVLNMGTGNFTIEFWCNYSAFTLNEGICVLKRTTNINAMYFLSGGHTNTAHPVFFTRNSGGTSVVATGSSTLSVDTWYHCAGVRNGSNCYVYLNGVQDGTASGAAVNTDNTEALIIGADLANSAYTNLKLADIRIWNVARSVDDIKANMFKRLVGNEANLVSYWPLDEGTETTGTNIVSGGANITFNGSPAWSDIHPPIQGSGTILID